MSNDNGRFSQKYISSRFLFFSFFFSFENEPSEFWRYLREKKSKSKGRFVCFVLLFFFFFWQITLAKKTEKRN